MPHPRDAPLRLTSAAPSTESTTIDPTSLVSFLFRSCVNFSNRRRDYCLLVQTRDRGRNQDDTVDHTGMAAPPRGPAPRARLVSVLFEVVQVFNLINHRRGSCLLVKTHRETGRQGSRRQHQKPNQRVKAKNEARCKIFPQPIYDFTIAVSASQVCIEVALTDQRPRNRKPPLRSQRGSQRTKLRA